MKILVLNAGSSSIKYQLFDMENEQVLAKGLIDCIGEPCGHIKQYWYDEENQAQHSKLVLEIPTHHDGLLLMVEQLRLANALRDPKNLAAIGHRVVHGGNVFQNSVLIDNLVIDAIKRMTPLAPLHNPANLEGIEIAQQLLPTTPQVAVFDTAFHQTMPPEAYRYAVPEDWYKEHHIRRYGFHGTSHRCVAQHAAYVMQKDFKCLNLITLHLGNGCSITAIKNGESVDTSMGMTPLEGLIMGTRSGDIDPALLSYIHRQTQLGFDEIDELLSKRSGLKGLAGVSDMREIGQRSIAGDKAAQLAETAFVYRIRKYIGAYAVVLGNIDAIVLTGGIGENSAIIREKICQNMDILGIQLDYTKNASISADKPHQIQSPNSNVKILMIPTNEELAIARSAKRVTSKPVDTPVATQQTATSH